MKTTEKSREPVRMQPSNSEDGGHTCVQNISNAQYPTSEA